MTGEEQELVAFLGRAFPSLAGLAPHEGARRAEALGLYAASLVAQGASLLASRGLGVPADMLEPLVAEAQRTGQQRAGGVLFLARVRASLLDARFAPWIATVAQLFRAGPGAVGGGTQTGMPAGPSRELGGFELLALLGEGAMGKVYKARQKSLDRFVALKVLSRQLAMDQDFVQRFHAEAKAAARLTHPNVVGVIDQGTDPATNVHYIAFEFIDGQTLEELLRAQKKLPERQGLEIARGVADGLAMAEREGIVHRDVKPDNILITRAGEAKLVDLGLAKKRDEPGATSSAGIVVGTPAYMSPEQAMGLPDIDHRADLYALGMTLFRALTGRFAFEGENATAFMVQHVHERCPDPRAFEASISESAARVILRLCARERERRYASATDVVRDLDLVLAGRPPALGASLGTTPASGTPALALAGSGPRPAMGGGVPDEPPWAQELVPASIPDATLGPPPSQDPGEALLQALERSGDPEHVKRAMDQLQALVQGAGSNRAAAARAEASLARAFLLRGDRANAERRAQAALERDPRCRDAAQVLARTQRGDADRCRLEAVLAQVRFLLGRGSLDEARAVADALREAFPQEPHPLLALAAVARLAGNEADFIDSVRRAWGLFPSRERADVWLGGLDGLVCDLLVAQGRSAYRGDGSLLKQTVEGLDEKSNLVAGSLRTAIGIARVALERGNLTLFEQRRLHFALARGLAGLRRYDAALDEIARASQFRPSDVETAAYEAEKAFVNYMKNMDAGSRAVPQPRYRCLGALALVDLARARLALAVKERSSRGFDLEKTGIAVAGLARTDAAAKAELRTAAEKAGDRGLFDLLEPAEAELAEIARERAQTPKGEPAAPKPSPGGTGFFGKLKGIADAAASGVASAAKEAQWKLREAQANARLEAAAKRFAARFAKDLSGVSYANPELAQLARKVGALATALDVYADEEARAKKDVERLSAFI